MNRLTSVDALRGAVMIVMALDHARDFVHRGAMSGASPTDLTTTTPILFMTRWVTHFCAPVFMFTAGLGAYFYLQGKTRPQLSWFLVTRGLWLIVLELTVMQLAYNFDISSSYPVFLLVLWALGACMIVLAALIWLPLPLLAAISIAVIVLHHLADAVRLESLWMLLHQAGVFPLAGRTIIAPYTLVPWFAVMALGFCVGPVFSMAPEARRRLLLRAGIGLTIAFLIIRVINVYGDPSKWAWQASASLTMMSFLNTSKYPPSLAFLLMTLGPALIALSWLDDRRLSRSNPLIVFGRVPLFYFVLHFFAAHLAMVLLSLVRYGPAALDFMFQPLPSTGGPAQAFPPGFGYDLWVVYVVWVVIVAGLYPACRWFAGLKERSRRWWLSYL
ncbi:MAG TPA: heparan-alpha-glucosaminide N-acetyltransferase domain-containing protein [Vicinamibacterales bacterium]|nr:heparan-alpha-glucosaminide N-acetyltransferase domain-containing protein [Vicinamibacterales bacterium]